MTKCLIRNNEPNIKDFPSVDSRRQPLVLIPGINEVDKEMVDWIEAQQNTSWIHWFETRVLEFVELEKTTGEKTSEIGYDDLLELRSDDAIKLVEGTNNLNALLHWQRVEKRKGVGNAIMDKLAKLRPSKRE